MGQSTREIENNIKNIQARMSERVDHLSDDLSLSSLASRTLGAKGNKPGELVDAALDTVRRHPLPAALIGVGLVGLIASQKSRSSDADSVAPVGNSYNPSAQTTTAQDPADRVASHVNALKSEVGQKVAAAGETLNSVKESASEAVGNVTSSAKTVAGDQADQLRHAYSDVRSKAGNGSEQLREQISAGGEAVRRRAQETSGQIRDTSTKAAGWARENPVPLGLMALAIGAAAASVLTAKTKTRSEDEQLPESDVEPHHIPPYGSASRIEEPVARAESASDAPVKPVAKPKPKSKSKSSTGTTAKKSPSRKPSASASSATAANGTKSAAEIAAAKARSLGTDRSERSIGTGSDTQKSAAKA